MALTTMMKPFLFKLLVLLACICSPTESYLAPAAISRGRVTFYQTPNSPKHHSSTSILPVTSNDFNEGDFTNATTSSVSETSNNEYKDFTKTIPSELLMQVGAAAVLALVAYLAVTSLLSGIAGMASSASHALGDEVVREMAQLGSNLWSLVGAVALAVWEVLTVVVPFVGKGIVDTGKAVAPVVSEASSRLSEAATPYVQEATRAVGEAASPYVQEASRVVDESLVTPMKSAVDANIVAPIQGAQTAVTSQLDAVQSSVTSQIDSTLNDVGQTVSSTIQGATDQATSAVKGAVDAQAAKIAAPIQEMTGKVDMSVKETVKPLQGLF